MREKYECVGRVQKPTVTRLRNVKDNEKGKQFAADLPLSGKGRIIEKHMASLQLYYGKAIRGNSDSLENVDELYG
ncbi:hypothetical protein HPB48_001576 [Haemaphysalis longicornis]|uniref:Uncharacterized protein n=1 Tax=Haemaphysalis longicornis TaxID=44386 RepID=A0A9J6FE08_HAELO|nr:hypothetical protein HPB48_001576 [Haemaphysalis longicornis]